MCVSVCETLYEGGCAFEVGGDLLWQSLENLFFELAI